jgi:BioD-like phosphotransacetylase family protein
VLYSALVRPLLVIGRAGSGKTTVALGLAHLLGHSHRQVTLLRLGTDQRARHDARLFHRLGLSTQGEPLSALPPSLPTIAVVEGEAEALPPGWQEAGARVVVVARYPHVQDALSLLGQVEEALLGMVVTCVPERRQKQLAKQLAGAPVLGMVQEDRLLAFPTLGQLQEAVEAQAFWSVGHEEMALSRVVISSIAKDPGQDYFARLRPDAVIVRSDKPDQQLAALNVGVRCLLVTGDTPILPYVLARAEEEGTAILATPLGTVEVAERLDALIASAPLAGREKAERAAHLVASAIDAERVLASLRGP